MQITIVHVITSLTVGGAQTMLCKVLSLLDPLRFTSVVVSLMERGTIGEHITTLGIPVHALGMQQGRPALSALWRLGRYLRHLKPQIVQGWMYHGNIAASLARLFLRRVPVVWNIRHTPYDLGVQKPMTATLIKLGSWLSTSPSRIVYNAQASAHQHELLHYSSARRCVIPNGFDCMRFHPAVQARVHLRQALGLGPDTLLIGLVGRYHPMKDHANFVRAASRLVERLPAVHFVLVGQGVSTDNRELMGMITAARLELSVHLLGERLDIPDINAGLDIACCCSWAESFPNVVGEAMACGVPCVVTDVGDTAWIVGQTGLVVPPREAEALATAWATLIAEGAEERQRRGHAARQRVVELFSLPTIVRQYETMYSQVVREFSGTKA